MAAARAPWRDIAALALEVVGAIAVARWAWHQLAAAGYDLLAGVERHQHRQDALARCTRPRAGL